MTVNERLRRYCRENGINQKQLSDLTGISVASINNLFKDKSEPSFDNLRALIAGLPGINTAPRFSPYSPPWHLPKWNRTPHKPGVLGLASMPPASF